MAVIGMGLGTCTLGCKRTDKDGNVISQTPARWEAGPDGGSVAIWPMDPETGEASGPAEIFGDWDAAGYLARALELIGPRRRTNLPDLPAMIRKAAADGMDLCEYCAENWNCQDCIVNSWKEADT